MNLFNGFETLPTAAATEKNDPKRPVHFVQQQEEEKERARENMKKLIHKKELKSINFFLSTVLVSFHCFFSVKKKCVHFRWIATKKEEKEHWYNYVENICGLFFAPAGAAAVAIPLFFSTNHSIIHLSNTFCHINITKKALQQRKPNDKQNRKSMRKSEVRFFAKMCTNLLDMIVRCFGFVANSNAMQCIQSLSRQLNAVLFPFVDLHRFVNWII